MNRLVLLAIIGMLLIFADQVSKDAVVDVLRLGETYPVIPGFFSIASVRNTGAAFGMGGDGPELMRQILFLALPVVFCFWILYMFYQSRK